MRSLFPVYFRSSGKIEVYDATSYIINCKRGHDRVNAMDERKIPSPSPRAVFLYWIFPLLFGFLFLFPLLLIDSTESHYNEKPLEDRRLNLKGLELITTHYLNENPEAFDKLIRIVTDADEALQIEESPSHAAVMAWLEKNMLDEGFNEEMPVYYYLKNVYLTKWEGAYFRQLNSGEREYLYDLLGAMIGGLYRCTCAPTHLQQS